MLVLILFLGFVLKKFIIEYDKNTLDINLKWNDKNTSDMMSIPVTEISISKQTYTIAYIWLSDN